MAAPFQTDLQTRRFFDRLRDELADETARINAVREVRPLVLDTVERARTMASLAAVADRIKAKKAVYGAKAEEWSKRLDKLDKLEPNAFAAGDAAVEAHENDLAGFERDMRALTNLPTS